MPHSMCVSGALWLARPSDPGCSDMHVLSGQIDDQQLPVLTVEWVSWRTPHSRSR